MFTQIPGTAQFGDSCSRKLLEYLSDVGGGAGAGAGRGEGRGNACTAPLNEVVFVFVSGRKRKKSLLCRKAFF